MLDALSPVGNKAESRGSTEKKSSRDRLGSWPGVRLLWEGQELSAPYLAPPPHGPAEWAGLPKRAGGNEWLHLEKPSLHSSPADLRTQAAVRETLSSPR